jgi:predicted DNA-binding ribbon-helix-helix protein
MSQLTQEKRPRHVPLGAFVPRELHEAVERLARREDRSMSSILRVALGNYLREQAETKEASWCK